jgi:hypothetical protein
VTAEELAELFHTTYERLAPGYQWTGNRSTRCAWPDLPANNRALMVATVEEVLDVLGLRERVEEGIDLAQRKADKVLEATDDRREAG